MNELALFAGAGGAFSVESYLDGLRCARLKLTSLPDACCCTGSSSDTCPGFPSGTTSAHSTASPGGGLSMSCPADFHARTSARPEKAQGWQGHAADCGERCAASFARFDLVSCSWRIHPCLFPEDSPLYLGTWPQQGMMRRGLCWEQTMWEHHMSARESGFSHAIPTPTACNAPNAGGNTKRPKSLLDVARTGWNPGEAWLTPMAQDGMRSNMKLESLAKHWERHPNSNLAEQVAVRELYPTPTCQDAKNNGGKAQMERNTPPLNAVVGGALNPVWVEWLMGWPLGWTDCGASETARFRSWLRRLSGCLKSILKRIDNLEA